MRRQILRDNEGRIIGELDAWGRDDNESGAVYLLLFGAFLLFVLVPGMVGVTVYRLATNDLLDPGQMWVFAGVVSIAVWIVVYLLAGRVGRSLGAYCVLSLFAVTGLVVSHFGFHASFPQAMLFYYFPNAGDKRGDAVAANSVAVRDETNLRKVQTVVREYLRTHSPDPSAIQLLDWRDLSTDGSTSSVTLHYRVRQPSPPATDAMVRFDVRDGGVVGTELISQR